jgi:hypothetical protein
VSKDGAEFHTTAYRWVIAFGIFGLIINAIMATQIFAAVSVQMSDAIGIDFFWVEFSMLSCNLVIIPMNFGAAYLYNKWQQRYVLYFACALQLAGAWLRVGYVLYDQFWSVIVGQFLIFSTAPMTHNIIGLVSNTWFPEH